MNDLQKLTIDSPLVELFTLDCTALGGTVFRFTPHFTDYAAINYLTFDGNAYTSIPITTDGWEITSTGTQPRPTLSVSNINLTLLSAVISLGDIVGAKLTRIRTFAKFLDTGPTPDTSQFLGPDVFYIEQKIAHNKELISWQLSSVIDKFGIGLPRQQITKDNAPGVGRARGAF